MLRRDFLKSSTVIGAGALAGGVGIAAAGAGQHAPAVSTRRPLRILMGGYSPADNGFSIALKRIGDRVSAKFKGDVDVKYVYNILDLGYRGEDILWLVESGVLTLGYQSSSYLTERVPDLGIADLPFLFQDQSTARGAMDGRFGRVMAERIEAGMDFRILGWFENGFRHVSNRLRPVRVPADLKGMTIRVLPARSRLRSAPRSSPEDHGSFGGDSRGQGGDARCAGKPVPQHRHVWRSQLLQIPHGLESLLPLVRSFCTGRRSTAGRVSCRTKCEAAVADAVAFQRNLHVKEEEDAAAAIRKVGGEIVELTPEQHKAFVDAVRPIYGEARSRAEKICCRSSTCNHT